MRHFIHCLAWLTLVSCGSVLVAQEAAEKSTPETADESAPDTGEESAPDTAESAAPDTAESAAPDTAEAAADGAPALNEADPNADDLAAEQVPFASSEEMELEFERRLDRYLDLRAELAEAMSNQREVFIRFVNEEDRTPQARQSYRELRARTRELLNETFSAALDVSRLGFERESATFMVTMIEHRLFHDIYDEETMEGAARLIDGGSRLPSIFLAGFRSAVVAGNFDIATKLFEALSEEQAEDIDRQLAFNLEAHKANWAIESEARQQDAANDNLPRVEFETTQGKFVVELFLDRAPSTVAHFIKLIEDRNFYDELDFYQVIDHALAVTGDQSGEGTGTSGEFVVDEFSRDNARVGWRGSLVMAKVPIGDTGSFYPNSASSQFAILFLPLASILEKQQTVFGRVIEGMEVISRLRRVNPSKEKKDNEIVYPPDRILSARVIRRPETLPEPQYADPTRSIN